MKRQVVSDSVLGTPAYMSPEQAKGEKIDQRADLFSLGSVIFTMCSGQAAFSGGETLSVMRGVMEAERIELPDGVRIEKRLSRVINRLHSALPENRYRSADEVLQDLRRQSGNPKRRLLLPLAYITAFVLVLGFLVGGTSFILNGTFLPSGKATWTQARQRLADVTSEIERVDSFFESDDCFYEIDHGKFTYLNIPYSYDLSAFGQFSDVEHLVLTPRNPRDNTPVDISFVDSMNKLRVVELANFPVESLEPLRGHQLEKLHLWYVQTKGQPYPSHVDLDPLKGMPLKWLNCGGCIIESLEPLKGMKLEFLCLNESAKVSDLSPLIGMPIHKLIIAKSDISDLTPMSRSQLKILDISGSKVRDLSPLVGLKLEHLLMNRSQIDDLAILKKCHIKTLDMDYEPGHEELVKSIPGLETLNQMPLADFIKANRKQ